jgi:serine/threonine-protein kinase RsbT
MAMAEGYPRLMAQEVALITSELAWNIVRHGGGGYIELAIVVDPKYGPGIEIHACDAAPPIADLALAQRDGHTAIGPIPAEVMLTRRGIGSGLGAVARLGDRLLQVPRGTGKCLVVTRFLTRPRPV